MRILVCGGRDYSNRDLVFATLDELNYLDLVIIQGGARGADRLAKEWALANQRTVDMEEYPADWDKHGKAAGPIRNMQMLDGGKPDLVLAFPGGTGTVGMIKLARAAGVKVLEINEHKKC